MKTVTVITGNTGVGKSTVAEKLMRSVPESGWYDCDTAWKTNPLAELKNRMIGVSTMCAAATDTYFAAGLQNVFLSGVLPGDFHFDRIKSLMSSSEFKFRAFWLTCEERVNRQRLISRDGHDNTYIKLSKYLEDGAAVPVDCTSTDADEVVDTIRKLMKRTC
jgi:hypothetical protein